MSNGQLFYARLERQSHPACRWFLSQLTNLDEIALDPDQEDYVIADEIIDLFGYYGGVERADGEWGWINANRRGEYIDVIKRGDGKLLARKLANAFRCEVTHGIISSYWEDRKRVGWSDEFINEILLDMETWREFAATNPDETKLLDSPQVGNPYGLHYDGVLISRDTLRHDYFAKKLIKIAELCQSHEKENEGSTILEIGGGYGGLALQLHRRSFGGGYINVDLLETLFVSYYFLKKSTRKTVKWAERAGSVDVKAGEILFIPSHLADKLAGHISIAFNANSFSEMARDTVFNYFALLNRLGPGFILHENSNWLLFQDSERHVEVLASEFPVDGSKYLEIAAAISPWRGAGGRYREYLFARK